MRLPVPFCIAVGIALTGAMQGCTKPAEGDEAASRGAVPAPTPVVAEPRAETPERPGVKPDGSIVSAVRWHEDRLETALAEAKSGGKLVLADVGAYWCPPCHRLDEEVFTQATVGEFVGERFVAIHIDAEKGEGPEVVDQYRIQAFPTLLVLDADGVEKGRVVDYLPAMELMAALAKVAEGDNVLSELVEAVRNNPDDFDARYRLGHAYALSARREEAAQQFDAVTLADPRDELGLASQVLYDRAFFFTYKMDGDPEGAMAAFARLQERFPDSKAAHRAYRAIGRLLHQLGRSDEAVARLDTMLAQDPEDVALASSYGWFSFRHQCHPKRGLEVVEGAAKRTPDNAELQYLRAELLHQLGRSPEALVAMKQASALEPKSAYYKRQVRRFERLAGA